MCIYLGGVSQRALITKIHTTWNNTNNTFTCVYYIYIFILIYVWCVLILFCCFLFFKNRLFNLHYTVKHTRKINIILFMFMKHTQHVTRQRNNLIRHCMWYSPIGTESFFSTKKYILTSTYTADKTNIK